MRPVRRLLTAALAFAMAFSAIPASASYTSTVGFADATRGFLGGWSGNDPRSGFISVTSDAGLTWHAIMTGQSSPTGLAISGAQSAAAASLGDDAVFATTNAGAAWTRVTPIAGTGAGFSDMAKSSVGVVAVGTRPGTEFGDVGTIYTSPDGVSGWTQRFIGPIKEWPVDAEGAHPDPRPLTYARMDQVAFAPDGVTGWAIGSEWSDPTYATASWKNLLIYKTTNGGSTWTTVTPPAGLPTYPITDLTVPDATHAYAVGPGQYKIQTTNGTAWSRVDLPRIGNVLAYSLDAFGIDALDSTHVVVTGLTKFGLSAVQWTTDGVTWTPGHVDTSSFVKLRSVSMINANTWVVVGDDETIWRTTDAGAAWVKTGAKAPTVVLSAPATNATLNTASALVSGTASDVGVGVANVEVSVQRDGAEYWNGTTWVPGLTWNAASVSTTSSAWSWSWALEPGQNGSHTYVVSARSTDGVGQVSTIATKTGIKVTSPPDTIAPDVVITAPSSDTTLTGDQTTITGTATDNGGSGVAKVEVSIQRDSDSKYWNGSAWGATAVWNPATPSTPGYATWSLPWAFDRNQTGSITYTVRARATDVGANTSAPVQRAGVRINNPDVTPPTVAITYPSVDTTLGGTEALIAGLTTDTPTGTGVAQVEVSIQRSNGDYMNSLGVWVGSQAWIPSVLAADKVSWSMLWSFDPGPHDGTVGYTITARATDVAGNFSALSEVTGVHIVQDAIGPEVALGTPARVVVAPGQNTFVAGTATDVGTGIRQVDVAIQRGSQYWNGTAWVSGPEIWLASQLGPGDAFTYTWKLDPGQFGATAYTLHARATDNAGNVTIATPLSDVRVTNVALLTVVKGAESVYTATSTRLARRSTTRAVDQLRLTATNGSITVTSLAVTGRSSAKRLRTDVAEVALYLDDNDGVFEPAQDTKLASGRFAQAGTSVGTVTFGPTSWKSPLTVQDATTARVWVVYRIARSAVLGDVLGSAVSAARISMAGSAHLDVSASTPVIVSAYAGRTLVVRH